MYENITAKVEQAGMLSKEVSNIIEAVPNCYGLDYVKCQRIQE